MLDSSQSITAELDIQHIRSQFPLLSIAECNKPLVYLDNAATSQKPQIVLDAIQHYYCHDNANVHRGIYALSERATEAYESVRKTVQSFINAEHVHEIIFTRGTTEAINLVANSLGQLLQIAAGDEIVISAMEHHSNIVPWQLLCERTGAHLRIIPVLDDGTLDLATYRQLLSSKTKLVALVHVSNVLGTINPVRQMIEWAHAENIPVLLDGAQGVPHLPVNVRDLDCDFYAFSSHKMYGPTGVGVLYGKTHWLEQMPPYQGGGDMIYKVTFEKTEYAPLPNKFEAGTPNIAGVVGLGAAIDFLHKNGMQNIAHYENKLTHYALQQLKLIPGLKILGHEQTPGAAVISLVLAEAHPHDISTVLDSEGVAVRAGHHCAMPLMDRFKVPATVRVSFGIYNTREEVDHLQWALQKVIELFGE